MTFCQQIYKNYIQGPSQFQKYQSGGISDLFSLSLTCQKVLVPVLFWLSHCQSPRLRVQPLVIYPTQLSTNPPDKGHWYECLVTNRPNTTASIIGNNRRQDPLLEPIQLLQSSVTRDTLLRQLSIVVSDKHHVIITSNH